MTHALDDHSGTLSVSEAGPSHTNLRFADDINGLGGGGEELLRISQPGGALRSVIRQVRHGE